MKKVKIYKSGSRSNIFTGLDGSVPVRAIFKMKTGTWSDE